MIYTLQFDSDYAFRTSPYGQGRGEGASAGYGLSLFLSGVILAAHLSQFRVRRNTKSENTRSTTKQHGSSIAIGPRVRTP